ncbi:MAG: hypothetical protein IBX60_03710 [Candidatus Aminicenantes bacterium]|nr:hypothetical protein [Candidatus Aminicenantes bacterium]
MRRTTVFHINSKTYILGQKTWSRRILNVIHDSFSYRCLYLDKERATQGGLELVAQGEDIIDTAGESS